VFKQGSRPGWDSEGEALSSAGQILASDLMPAVTVEEAQWYAIQTRPNHEKKVVAELERKAITMYLPLVQQVHRWSDRFKVVQVPLFSGYAFVHAVVSPAVRLCVLRVWGVLGFVGPQKQALPIPANQIEDIRRLLRSNVPFVWYPFPRVGQRVRVQGGCLDGTEGILVDRQGDRRFVIAVDAIERSLSISVEGYKVVPI
jgi:transcriptional antiterminator NusG